MRQRRRWQDLAMSEMAFFFLSRRDFSRRGRTGIVGAQGGLAELPYFLSLPGQRRT
jgi:hypothetical protein